ncbi:MAG: hypothetical protein WA102_07290 [Candidatus Methanoperedens sp.]
MGIERFDLLISAEIKQEIENRGEEKATPPRVFESILIGESILMYVPFQEIEQIIIEITLLILVIRHCLKIIRQN